MAARDILEWGSELAPQARVSLRFNALVSLRFNTRVSLRFKTLVPMGTLWVAFVQPQCHQLWGQPHPGVEPGVHPNWWATCTKLGHMWVLFYANRGILPQGTSYHKGHLTKRDTLPPGSFFFYRAPSGGGTNKGHLTKGTFCQRDILPKGHLAKGTPYHKGQSYPGSLNCPTHISLMNCTCWLPSSPYLYYSYMSVASYMPLWDPPLLIKQGHMPLLIRQGLWRRKAGQSTTEISGFEPKTPNGVWP